METWDSTDSYYHCEDVETEVYQGLAMYAISILYIKFQEIMPL